MSQIIHAKSLLVSERIIRIHKQDPRTLSVHCRWKGTSVVKPENRLHTRAGPGWSINHMQAVRVLRTMLHLWDFAKAEEYGSGHDMPPQSPE